MQQNATDLRVSESTAERLEPVIAGAVIKPKTRHRPAPPASTLAAHGEVALRHQFCPLETGVKISTESNDEGWPPESVTSGP
jgi:hypothetical protein